MATSFLNYQTKGFWLQDTTFCILIRQIQLTISTLENKEYWLKEMEIDLIEESKGYYIGFTSMSLDDYIINGDRRTKFVEVINITIHRLNDKNILSVEELNNITGSNITFSYPIKANKFVKILNSLILLLMSSIYLTASDTTGWEFEEEDFSGFG